MEDRYRMRPLINVVSRGEHVPDIEQYHQVLNRTYTVLFCYDSYDWYHLAQKDYGRSFDDHYQLLC